ncbi:MAG: TatD family hydrolase [Muribaculaceae bacterium]|nr:TatD family hydrolase [Muribaculaceae bacterium]
MLTDTHTHLYDSAFANEGTNGPADAVRRALNAGVDRLVFPNVDLTTIEPMKRLAAQFPQNITMAIGLHPTEVNPESLEDDIERIQKELSGETNYVAVGEVGMDLYWSKEYEDAQKQAFDRQCTMAENAGLPVIIHCREALEQTLEVLKSHPNARVVFHSFGGSVEDVRKIRALIPDAYFGINGIVTFKNSGLREVLPEIGINRILLETDSPYLAPVPKRGKRNESAYLKYIAECVAGALELTCEEVADRTSKNASEFLGI